MTNRLKAIKDDKKSWKHIQIESKICNIYHTHIIYRIIKNKTKYRYKYCRYKHIEIYSNSFLIYVLHATYTTYIV